MTPKSTAADFTAFAPTKMLDTDYPGRKNAGLRLFRCSCAADRFTRRRRSLWMRFLPLLRLYQCVRCGAKVLRPRLHTRSAYPASVHYMSPPSSK